MSAAREAILGRLREAIGRSEAEKATAEAAVEARLAAPAPNLIPARGKLDPEGRIALFQEMVEAVNGEVRRLSGLGEVAASVAAYLREHNLPQRVVAAHDARLDHAGWDGQPLLRVRRGAAAEDDVTGVTLAMAGIAETGTLLLASSAERPSLLAFLPENSIVVVRAADIDGAYEESWARLRALGPPPRSVNLITGPSRTGDIAQKIELGAHGPRRLLVLIVDEDAA
jgi:L-lactate dehydrogenase complex protein LldG